MSHAETVCELGSILNPQNEARPTVLLGAGVSFSSGAKLINRFTVNADLSITPKDFLGH